MTKKRKRYPDLNQKLERPWCYYCERDFDDLKILISHQKAKHFKCDRCGRRLNTAGGLSVHMNQVHKETLSHVENAMPGRQGLDIEIFGMEGVPAEIVDQHTNQVTQKHFQEAEERAQRTGNPARGEYSDGAALPSIRAKVKESLEGALARATNFRQDKANGVIPLGGPVEAPTQPSPPVPQPYGAPSSRSPPFAPGAQTFPPPAAPGFSPGQPFPQAVPGFQPPFGAASLFGQGPSSVNGGMPPRQGSIPGTTGLPQRPPFGGPPSGAFPPGHNSHPPSGVNGAPQAAIAASVDELISSAAAASAPTEASPAEKKSKKEKNIKLIYFDDNISPEEKMAALNRYASKV